MATDKKFDLFQAIKFIKVSHIMMIITLIGCTYKCLSTGSEWYLNIMKEIQKGKIDKDDINGKIGRQDKDNERQDKEISELKDLMYFSKIKNK